jgi:hypothetical protein
MFNWGQLKALTTVIAAVGVAVGFSLPIGCVRDACGKCE